MLKKLIWETYEVDELDIDKLEKVPTGLNCLKSKLDK